MAQQTRQTLSGTCKRFNVEKGYGFIEMDDGSEDVFVHYSDINSGGFQSLTTGESLEFSVVEDDGRRKAINVTGPNGGYVAGAKKELYGGANTGRGQFAGGKKPRGYTGYTG
eukprot:126414_1